MSIWNFEQKVVKTNVSNTTNSGSSLLTEESLAKENFYQTTLEVRYYNKTVNNGSVKDIGYVINKSETVAMLRFERNEKLLQNLFKVYIEDMKNNKQSNTIPSKNYYPLPVFSFDVDGVVQRVSFVNEESYKLFVANLCNSIFEDVTKIYGALSDCNNFFRYTGESTLDAQKKQLTVDYSLLPKRIKALSTMHLISNIDYFSYAAEKITDLKITRKGKYGEEITDYFNAQYKVTKAGIEAEDIKPYVKRNKKNELVEVIFDDAFSKPQNKAAIALTTFANGAGREIYNNITGDSSIIEEIEDKNLGLFVRDLLRTIGKMFGHIWNINIEANKELDAQRILMDEDLYADEKSSLKSDLQENLKNLKSIFMAFIAENNISSADAGLLAYAISVLEMDIENAELKLKAKPSSLMMKLVPELFCIYLAEKNDKDIATLELIGVGDIINGEVIKLVDGKYNNYSAINSKYTGYATVKIIGGKIYATKNLEEMLMCGLDVSNRRLISVYEKNFVDINASNANGRLTFTDRDDVLIEIIRDNTAKLKFVPKLPMQFRDNIFVYNNILIALVDGKVIPVAKYTCSSNEMEEIIGGVVFTTDSVIIHTPVYMNGILLEFEVNKKVAVERIDHNLSTLDKKATKELLAEYGITNNANKYKANDFDFGDPFSMPVQNPEDSYGEDDFSNDAFM